MFHVSTIKKLFKLRASDYNKIAEYLNNLCGGLGINIKRPDNPSATHPPVVELDRNTIGTILQVAGNPKDGTDDGLVPVVEGDLSDDAAWTWNAGGANGLKLDMYCLVTKPSSSSRYHDLRRCRLTISRFGTVMKAEMQPDGVRIQA